MSLCSPRPPSAAGFLGHQQPEPSEGKEVILWPDTFTDHFTPEIGIAAVSVLERAGYAVRLPERQLCCGRPLYDYGMLPTANRRRIALQMVRDMLDESSFEASPAHTVPGSVGKAAAKLTGKLRRNGDS